MKATTEIQVKERPILFSAPMVRAILEGRKTQTRRIVKPQPTRPVANMGMGYFSEEPNNLRAPYLKCPYGEPGERLWVRETWAGVKQLGGIWVREKFHYRASEGDNELIKWKPSIHMPRVACRIILEITNIRVERLQDISDKDAAEEGLFLEPVVAGTTPMWRYNSSSDWYSHTKNCFKGLWQSINGEGSWDANPFVWVVDFKQVKP